MKFQGTMKGLFSSAIVMAATPALADWQFTRWGMTIEEVIVGAGGKTTINEDRSKDTSEELVSLLRIDHTSGGFDFVAFLEFDRNKTLARVSLEPKSSDTCGKLPFALSSTYGPPQTKSGNAVSEVLKWWHAETGNVVTFFQIGADCWLIYSPFTAAGSEGGL